RVRGALARREGGRVERGATGRVVHGCAWGVNYSSSRFERSSSPRPSPPLRGREGGTRRLGVIQWQCPGNSPRAQDRKGRGTVRLGRDAAPRRPDSAALLSLPFQIGQTVPLPSERVACQRPAN